MQTKLQSAIETIVSTATGYLVAVLANIIILPLFGYPVSTGDSFLIGIIFTVISMVRGFLIRRIFNTIHK